MESAFERNQIFLRLKRIREKEFSEENESIVFREQWSIKARERKRLASTMKEFLFSKKELEWARSAVVARLLCKQEVAGSKALCAPAIAVRRA